jgi:hypothetical protein
MNLKTIMKMIIERLRKMAENEVNFSSLIGTVFHTIIE